MRDVDADLMRRFLEERSALCLSRMRSGLLLAMAVATVSSLGTMVWTSYEFGAMSAYTVVVAALCLGGWWIGGTTGAARYAIQISVSLVLTLALALAWRAEVFGESPEMLLQGLTLVVLAPAIVIPWGGRAQAVVAGLVSVVFFTAWLHRGPDPAQAVYLVSVLAAACLMSVAGAHFLDSQRLETTIQQAQVNRSAVLQSDLLAAGQRLGETLDEADLWERIVDLAAGLSGCDQSSLTLFRDDAARSRVVAIGGPKRLRIQELLDVEVPVPPEFCAELTRAPTTEVPGESVMFDEGVLPVMHRFGVARTLFVPLRRGGRLLGYLNLDRAEFEPSFSRERRRTIEVFAQQAATALSNARLVQELQAASRAKTDFVSMMSHELRTPLNVIVGYADIVADVVAELPDPSVAGYIRRLRRAAEQQLDLVERTLELNRLESGQDLPVFERVSLRQVWADLAREFADLGRIAPERSARVSLIWDEPPEAVVRTDRRRLQIVLRNLVGNALKFTTEGEIRVAARLARLGLVVEVRDTGIGIEADRIGGIFNMFEQAQEGEVRDYTGVGLGLYLVRRYVEQLGGAVRVESTRGVGTTFFVELPGSLLDRPTEGT